MRHILSIFVVLLVIACTGNNHSAPQTPAQTMYLVKSQYRSALTVMVHYREQCLAKPKAYQKDCKEHVKSLQKLDAEAYNAIEYADGLKGKSGYEIAVEAAEAALNEAYEYLNRIQLQEGAAGHKLEPQT